MTGGEHEMQQLQMIQHILLLKRTKDEHEHIKGASQQTEENAQPKSMAAQSNGSGARTLRRALRDPARDGDPSFTEAGDAVPADKKRDVVGGGRARDEAIHSWHDSSSSGAETPPSDGGGEGMWGFESSSSAPPTPPESDAEIPQYDWKQWATASEALRLELFGRSDGEIQRAMGFPRKHAPLPHRKRRSWNLGDFESDEDG